MSVTILEALENAECNAQWSPCWRSMGQLRTCSKKRAVTHDKAA